MHFIGMHSGGPWDLQGSYILVDEICVYGVVQLNGIGFSLPVGRKDDHRRWLHLFGDLSPETLKHGKDWVLGVILDVRLGVS